MPLFFISHPISIINNIFEVVILSKAVLFSVHPLSVINFFLFELISCWFSEENSYSMLFTLLELSSILKVLLVKVIDSVAFDPFASPGANVNITIRESILFLNKLPCLFIIGVVGSLIPTSLSVFWCFFRWGCLCLFGRNVSIGNVKSITVAPILTIYINDYLLIWPYFQLLSFSTAAFARGLLAACCFQPELY